MYAVGLLMLAKKVDTSKRRLDFGARGIFMVRKFDRELKLEAIRMASEEGSTAVEVEQHLGISKGVISRWKKSLRDRGGRSLPRHRPSE